MSLVVLMWLTLKSSVLNLLLTKASDITLYLTVYETVFWFQQHIKVDVQL